MSTESAAEAAPPKKSKGRVIVLLVLFVVLLGGGGGAAYYFLFRGAPAEASEAHAKPEPPSTGILALEPFVVNLADGNGSRFLRVTLSLVVEGEETAVELKENEVEKARIRSAVLELLAQQQGERLITPAGKSEVKKAIAAQVAHAVHEVKVVDVLFSEFVVQL